MKVMLSILFFSSSGRLELKQSQALCLCIT